MSSTQPNSTRKGFSSSDLVAGLVLTGFGVAFGVGSLAYDLGTGADMGPGMFPLATSVLLVILGITIVVVAFVAPARDPLDNTIISMGRLPWRAMFFITASLVWFALTVESLGFVPAAFGSAVLASYAQPVAKWWHPLVVAVGLTTLCWIVFVTALGLRVDAFGTSLVG